jgi:3-hydroxyacyl-[acyl-carrier-protein] dehydratase
MVARKMNKLRQAIVSSAIAKATENETNKVTRRFRFKPDFIGFSGHFPGYPILPAFVQILTAIVTLEAHQKCRLELATIEKAKFHLPLHPDLEIEVTCAQRQVHDKTICEARLTVSEGLASSFRFTYAEKRETPC